MQRNDELINLMKKKKTQTSNECAGPTIVSGIASIIIEMWLLEPAGQKVPAHNNNCITN